MGIHRNFRSIAERYLQRAIDLQELQEQLAPLQSQLAHLPADDPAAQLAGHIDVSLAELSLGHRSEDELRSFLRAQLPLPVMSPD